MWQVVSKGKDIVLPLVAITSRVMMIVTQIMVPVLGLAVGDW